MFRGEFPVGTKVTGCDFVHDVKLNGMYGEVVEGLRKRVVFHPATWSLDIMYTYKVRWATGDVDAIQHTNLFRRAPDASTLGWANAKVAALFFPMPLLPK